MICKRCRFTTERLLVGEWHSLSANDWKQQELSRVVSTMLTPRVTQALPNGWQGDYTIQRAKDWIAARDQEGATMLVINRSSGTPVGLMILFESVDEESARTVHLGYLLSESVWGKGLASELVQGFVSWCRTVEISSIIGGVERDNVPSIRVLEKNGFVSNPNTDDTAELFFELPL